MEPASDPIVPDPALRRTVLLDFDGVLVRDDSMGLFLRHHLARAPWRIPGVLATMPAAGPLIGHAPSRPYGLRLVVRSALAGWTLERFRARAATFGTRLAHREGAVLAGGLAVARAHLAAGDRVVVVTGSERTLARAVLDGLGLHAAELVASRVEARRGGLGIAVHTYGATKVTELAAHGIAPPWDIAYSDSLSDLPMLREAREAVLVDAGPRTLARARRLLGPHVRAVQWT